MDYLNENSSYSFTLTIRDPNGDVTDPDTLSYTIHDARSLNVIRTEENLSTVSGVATIEISPEDTVILNTKNEYEERILTIKANSGENNEFNVQFEYSVHNLHFVS